MQILWFFPKNFYLNTDLRQDPNKLEVNAKEI